MPLFDESTVAGVSNMKEVQVCQWRMKDRQTEPCCDKIRVYSAGHKMSGERARVA